MKITKITALLLSLCMLQTLMAGCHRRVLTKSEQEAEQSAAAAAAMSGASGTASGTASGGTSNASAAGGAAGGNNTGTAAAGGGGSNAKTTLTAWSLQDDESMFSAISDYEDAHKNVKFVVSSHADETAPEELKVAISAGKQPDILKLDHVYITAFGRQGQLLDLQKYGAGKIKSQYIPVCWNAVSYGGHVYGLPHDGNTIALMYNKTMLDKTGKSAPKNYNDMVQAGLAMAAANPNKTPFTSPFFDTASDTRINWAAFIYFIWLWRDGGDILNADYTKATFNSAAGVDALQKMIDLVQKYKICNGSSYMEQDFYAGNVGMIEMGNWSIPGITRSDSSINFQVTMMPQLKAGVPGYSGLGLYAMGITSACKNPAVAFDFISKLTTTDEYELEYCKQHSQLPVISSALKDKYYSSSIWQTYIAQYKLTKYRPGVTCWDQIQTIVANAVNSAVKGSQSAQGALNAAASQVNTLLAKNK